MGDGFGGRDDAVVLTEGATRGYTGAITPTTLHTAIWNSIKIISLTSYLSVQLSEIVTFTLRFYQECPDPSRLSIIPWVGNIHLTIMIKCVKFHNDISDTFTAEKFLG